MPIRAETDIVGGSFGNRICRRAYPGAKCIPLGQLPLRHADLGDGYLILVCEAGTRAGIAQKGLAQLGERVLVLDGGTRVRLACRLLPLATRWSLERQVRSGAGLLVLIGVALTLLVSKTWIVLPAFVGAGLTFAGATDICMMGRLWRLMPWSQLRTSDVQPACNR